MASVKTRSPSGRSSFLNMAENVTVLPVLALDVALARSVEKEGSRGNVGGGVQAVGVGASVISGVGAGETKGVGAAVITLV